MIDPCAPVAAVARAGIVRRGVRIGHRVGRRTHHAAAPHAPSAPAASAPTDCTGIASVPGAPRALPAGPGAPAGFAPGVPGFGAPAIGAPGFGVPGAGGPAAVGAGAAGALGVGAAAVGAGFAAPGLFYGSSPAAPMVMAGVGQDTSFMTPMVSTPGMPDTPMQPTAVPEPASVLLFLAGVLLTVLARRLAISRSAGR